MCTTHPVVWPSPQEPGCDSGGHTLSVQLPLVPGWPLENCSPGPRDSTGPVCPGESACSAAAEQDAPWCCQSAKTALSGSSWEDIVSHIKSAFMCEIPGNFISMNVVEWNLAKVNEAACVHSYSSFRLEDDFSKANPHTKQYMACFVSCSICLLHLHQPL